MGGVQNFVCRLDFAAPPAQKQSTVSPPFEDFYTCWRMPDGPEDALRDENAVPPERLLQAIWRHQRLRRDRLQTVDGQAVRILHPGFVSVEGGPDFRGAVIQIGEAAPRSGDVEIDLRAGGWRAHGHDRNPAFQNVLLHVVWEGPGVPASACRSREMSNQPKLEPQPLLPTLAVSDKLDAPIAELGLWLENDSPRVLPDNLRGQCCAVLRELDETRQGRILNAAARVRFQAKAEQFRARARHAGWEQSLWEGLFRALGYKHNVWPMQNLAEGRPRWMRGPDPAFTLQARLLGISGLLPGELPRATAGGDGYLRRVWDGWWRERDEFSDCLLPRAVWRFHGLRPVNHPQRRLALAAHWLAAGHLIQKLEDWCTVEMPDSRLPGSLRKILEVERDEFWSWHWTFRSARLPRPQPLLGAARVTDLAVNVVLPWLWTRAAEGGNEKIRRIIEHRHAVWPLAEDNSVLKLARQRLLGAGRSPGLRSASGQQGLIQITRDFCDHSNAVCEHCRFPELVRGWSAPTAI
jgi:hypothetical protein